MGDKDVGALVHNQSNVQVKPCGDADGIETGSHNKERTPNTEANHVLLCSRQEIHRLSSSSRRAHRVFVCSPISRDEAQEEL